MQCFTECWSIVIAFYLIQHDFLKLTFKSPVNFACYLQLDATGEFFKTCLQNIISMKITVLLSTTNTLTVVIILKVSEEAKNVENMFSTEINKRYGLLKCCCKLHCYLRNNKQIFVCFTVMGYRIR